MIETKSLNFKEIVTERHSVRQYKKNHQIPADDLREILELAHTAPSLWNLQHWRVIVVQDPEHKKALLPIAYNQQQVVDSSAVFVILGDLEANKTGEAAFQPLVDEGLLPQEYFEKTLQDINQAYAAQGLYTQNQAFLNSALFAMQLMLAAKSKGYDTGPMGGFDSVQLIKALNIPARFVPVMMITAGIQDSPAYKTTRLPLDEIVIHESF